MNLFQRSPIASPTAFDQLYQHNRLAVFRYIYGLTGGPPEDVEDLTAETFLRAWKARHRFDGDGSGATGWLIRIAKRLVIDAYRRNSTRPTLPLNTDLPFGALPEDISEANDQAQRLFDLLAGLPERPREIVVLRYLLAWPVADIARHLETSENNVSVTLHRALASLRQHWQTSESQEYTAALAAEEKI